MKTIHLTVDHHEKTVMCDGIQLDADYDLFCRVDIPIKGLGVKTVCLPQNIFASELEVVAATTAAARHYPHAATIWVIYHKFHPPKAIKVATLIVGGIGAYYLRYGDKWFPCDGFILDPINLSKAS